MSARAVAVIQPALIIISLYPFLLILSGTGQLHAYKELQRVKCNGEADGRDNPQASISRSEVHYFYLDDKSLAEAIVSFLNERPGGLHVLPASYLRKYTKTRHAGEIEVLVKDGRK